MKENQNIEWKETWRDEYLKWVCGFANANGGKIYIGKNDSGNVVGVKNIKKLLDHIPNKVINHLGIVCEVNLLTEKNIEFIEIVVPPYDVPISYHGKYHFRSGSTKQELKGTALNNFLLKKAGKTWDSLVEPKANFSDIDNQAIEAFKKAAVRSGRLPQIENEADLHQILENLRLLENKKLKRAALLLFAKDPRTFFINAYIKIGRFGKSDHDLLSQEVVEGNAFELADQTLEILDKKYFKKSISYEGLNRIETPEYPFEAIREVLLNAILHRQYDGPPIQISIYDDKLMVWNYGTLPNALTIEDLKQKHASYPVNPLLADVFYKGGLIEAWGRGTLKVIEECINSGLPEPDISVMTGGLLVTFYKDIYNQTQLEQYELNDRQLEALIFWKQEGEITNGLYQKKFQITDRTALRDLTDLTEKKLLIKVGEKKITKYIYAKRILITQ